MNRCYKMMSHALSSCAQLAVRLLLPVPEVGIGNQVRACLASSQVLLVSVLIDNNQSIPL